MKNMKKNMVSGMKTDVGDALHKTAEKDVVHKANVPNTLRGRAEMEFPNLPKIADADLVQEVFYGCVADTGRTYCGRKLCVVRLPAGLFGGKDSPKGACFPNDVYKYYTLGNGFINQCDITQQDGTPTPYWGMMQIMLETKEWSKKDEIINKVVTEFGLEAKALSRANDVLKTHAFHPCKKYAGMGYLVEDTRNVTGVKIHSVRARGAHETVEYLCEQRVKVAEAKTDDEVPIATHFVNNPH